MPRSSDAANVEDPRDVWPGHTQGEIDAYREGFGDALEWVLRWSDLTDEDRERIEGVLNA